MSKIKIILWANVLILIGGLFGPVWLGVLCILALCLAIPAAIAGTIILLGDRQNRVWDVKIERTPGEIYRYHWDLLADGEPVVVKEGSYFTDHAEGRTDTKIGALSEAAFKRREVLLAERTRRKAEFGPSTISLSGRRRKTHIHVPAAAVTPGQPESADNQQKRPGFSAQIWRRLEQFGNTILRR